MLIVFLVHILAVLVPCLFTAVIWHIGVFALFCVYKRNGGKYNFKKFVDTRCLRI